MESTGWNRFGLYLDDQDKLHILDPDKIKSSKELSDQCGTFIQSIGEFKEMVDEFVKIIEIVSKEVDKSKIDAFTSKHKLKSFELEVEQQKMILKDQILHQQSLLHRLQEENQLLEQEEQTQSEIVAQLRSQDMK